MAPNNGNNDTGKTNEEAKEEAKEVVDKIIFNEIKEGYLGA